MCWLGGRWYALSVFAWGITVELQICCPLVDHVPKSPHHILTRCKPKTLHLHIIIITGYQEWYPILHKTSDFYALIHDYWNCLKTLPFTANICIYPLPPGVCWTWPLICLLYYSFCCSKRHRKLLTQSLGILLHQLKCKNIFLAKQLIPMWRDLSFSVVSRERSLRICRRTLMLYLFLTSQKLSGSLLVNQCLKKKALIWIFWNDLMQSFPFHSWVLFFRQLS